MTGAEIVFAGSLALACQLDRGERAQLVIGNGTGQITGMEDEAVELGLIPYRGKLGSIRLLAMVRRKAETINWAILNPDRKGGYVMTWYSRTGRAKPVIWERGHCVVDATAGKAAP